MYFVRNVKMVILYLHSFFFFDIKSCDHSANVYSQHYGVIAKYPN